MKRKREERPGSWYNAGENRLHKWWTLRDLRLILIITRSCFSTYKSLPLHFVFTRGFYLFPGLPTGKEGWWEFRIWLGNQLENVPRPSDHKDIYQVTAPVIPYNPSPTFTRFSTEIHHPTYGLMSFAPLTDLRISLEYSFITMKKIINIFTEYILSFSVWKIVFLHYQGLRKNWATYFILLT